MAVGELAPETMGVPENITHITDEDVRGQLINLPGQVRMQAHERKAEFHSRQVLALGMPAEQARLERLQAEHHVWELNDNFPHSEHAQPL